MVVAVGGAGAGGRVWISEVTHTHTVLGGKGAEGEE